MEGKEKKRLTSGRGCCRIIGIRQPARRYSTGAPIYQTGAPNSRTGAALFNRRRLS